jgi:hypothetical protein
MGAERRESEGWGYRTQVADIQEYGSAMRVDEDAPPVGEISSRQVLKQVQDLLTELAPRVGGDGESREAQLVAEMIGSCLKLLRDRASVADIKILNTALKELRYAFSVFARFRGIRKVSTFGSARTQTHDRAYRLARDFARAITREDYMVITGAGGGIMRACQEGAGRHRSFGANIKLPFEQSANEFIERDLKLMTFKYFFTRKILFIKEADAVVLFPGGFGTHDEAFEALTLVQTGKTEPMPIVLLDVIGGTYWTTWDRYVKDHLLRRRLISEQDLSLYKVANRVSDAVAEIKRFYRVYHSMRIVGRRTVLRLNEPVSPDRLARLNRSFADILTDGAIVQRGVLPSESNEPDIAHLPRLVMMFDRENYGRLRQLIDVVNEE